MPIRMFSPKKSLTDGAQYFVRGDVPEWCRMRNVTLYQIPTYSHASNGLVEHYNRALLEQLKRLKVETKLPWIRLVDIAMNAIQQAPYTVLLYSPGGTGGISRNVCRIFVYIVKGC